MTRVEDLPFVVARIVAVLGDQQHAIDSKSVAVEQDIRHVAGPAEAEIARQFTGKVVIGGLVNHKAANGKRGKVKRYAISVAIPAEAREVKRVRHQQVTGG